MCSYGEGEAHVHATRVMLHRCVKEFLRLGERHDLLELAVNLYLLHPQDSAVQVNVFPSCQFGVETSAHLQQGAYTPVDPGIARGRLGDACEDFEEGTFASPVAADDAHH